MISISYDAYYDTSFPFFSPSLQPGHTHARRMRSCSISLMPLDFLHIAVCMHVRLNACVMVQCICLKVTVNNTVTCYKHSYTPHLDTHCEHGFLWLTEILSSKHGQCAAILQAGNAVDANRSQAFMR